MRVIFMGTPDFAVPALQALVAAGHDVVAAYTQPIEAGRCCMIFGNATLGKHTDGAPLVHCHAVVLTEAGLLKGGHILTTHCTVGAEPISVLVTSLDGFELRVAYDAETNISMFQPIAESHDA